MGLSVLDGNLKDARCFKFPQLTMNVPEPALVAVEELAVWMHAILPKIGAEKASQSERSQVPFSALIIVDSRDEEERNNTGYIRSSQSIPHVNFEDDDQADEQINALLNSVAESPNPAFIFHCAYSQVRGPFSARRFLSRCSVQDKQPNVFILQGGFNSWKQLSLQNELVSNFTMPPQ